MQCGQTRHERQVVPIVDHSDGFQEWLGNKLIPDLASDDTVDVIDLDNPRYLRFIQVLQRR